MKNNLSGLKNKNLHAYQQIKDMIISGTFTPGQALREIELSQILGMSRTPVREALRQLASEGFAHHMANRGVVVSGISLGEVGDLLEARIVIETNAMQLFMRRMDDTIFLPDLRNTLIAQKQALDCGQYAEFARHDHNFHYIIVAGARNEHLKRFWLSLIDHTLRVSNMIFYHQHHERLPAAYACHKKIFTAITAHNATTACELITTHINTLRSNLVALLLDSDREDQ